MGKSESSKSVQNDPTTVRLHITPLTPETTTALLPSAILDDAAKKTISYHTIPTFPEKSYGFLNLPVSKAEKLKRKLNGSVFRGVKVRVDEARPEIWHEKTEEEEGGKEVKKKRKHEGEEEEKKKKKKRGKEKGVLAGYELHGRKVQRGWTKEKKKEGRECLFKATLPPIPPVEEEKKDAKDRKGKKRKKGKVIKEFEKSTKFPRFLKNSRLDPKRSRKDMVNEFVEGVGWVDGKGTVLEKVNAKKTEVVQVQQEKVPEEVQASEKENVMGIDEGDEKSSSEEDEEKEVEEAISKKPKSRAKATASIETSDASDSSPNSEEEDSSSSEPSESGSDSESEALSEEDEEEEEEGSEIEDQKKPKLKKYILKDSLSKALPAAAKTTAKADSESSASESESEADSKANSDSSDTSSSDSSDQESENELAEETPAKSTIKPKTRNNTPAKTPIKAPSLQLQIPPIHPLEALYKPTETTAGTESSSGFKFSFGGSEDSDSDGDTALIVQTPYRDPLRYRSAAPTPDTAIGARRFFSPDSPSTENRGFLPSTPRAPRSSGDNVFESANTVEKGKDAPLLFPHSDSRFLGALSMWGRLPTAKTLEEIEEVEGEQEEEGRKRRRKKTDEEKDVKGGRRVKAWREKFYANRGDWNREWKRRRREVLKNRKKKEGLRGRKA